MLESQEKVEIAEPSFCNDLDEWNRAVADQAAGLDLASMRYRLFLVLPPDYLEKAGRLVITREELGSYHSLDGAYNGARREFVMQRSSSSSPAGSPHYPQEMDTDPDPKDL